METGNAGVCYSRALGTGPFSRPSTIRQCAAEVRWLQCPEYNETDAGASGARELVPNGLWGSRDWKLAGGGRDDDAKRALDIRPARGSRSKGEIGGGRLARAAEC